jgi:oligoendopeptidase F
MFFTSIYSSRKWIINTYTKEYVWGNLLEAEELQEYRFILNEWRENADKNLSEEELN